MHLSPRSGLLSCLLLAAVSDGVSAQSSVFEGGSFERVLGLGGQATAFTYRRTEASRRGLGLDLAVGLFPAALGPAALVLEAGVGSLLDVGPSPQIIPGLQAGIAAIIPLERRCSLRLDLTRRQLFPDGGSVALWNLGVGLTVLSLSRPASAR